MNGFNLISAIKRGLWLIDHTWVDDHIPAIQRVLEGGSLTEGKDMGTISVKADGVNLVTFESSYGWKEIPSGSIAVHYILGPIMQYGVCGPGTHQFQTRFISADQNDNIKGHLFILNTPGGQADGIKEFANSIRQSSKPKIGFADGGMIASGGMWIASALDAIYASSDLVSIGSIGAYRTLLDTSARDEMQGLRYIKIKAKQSVDKGKDYEDAIAGDKDALQKMENEVSFLAGQFIDAITEGRGSRLTSDEWNTGKMYSAQEAINLGLIDGIADLSDITKELSLKKSKTNMSKFNNVAALAGQDQVSQEALDLANADLTSAGITHVTLVEQSVIDEGVRVTEELATANSTIADQVTAIQEKDTRIQKLEGVIANRAKVDTGTKAVSGKDATTTAEIQDTTPVKVAAHNQFADNGFFSSSTQSK